MNSGTIAKVDISERFSLDIFSAECGYVSVQLKPDTETDLKMIELRLIMDDAGKFGKQEYLETKMTRGSLFDIKNVNLL